jgi:hypothetical protein
MGDSGNRKMKDERKRHTIAKALLVWFKQAKSMNTAIIHSRVEYVIFSITTLLQSESVIV